MSLRGEGMTEWRATMRSGVEPTPDWQDNLCEVLERSSGGEDLAVFCRSVISYCAKRGVEAQPRLYSCLALLSSPSPEHVNYTVSGIELSLRETKDIVNLATSGLSTWPAGEALASWINEENQEERFRNKSVLELGSGCGLSGIFLCLRSTCKQEYLQLLLILDGAMCYET